MGLFDRLLNNETKPAKEVVYSVPTSSLVKGSNYAKAESEGATVATVDEETAMKIGAVYQGINIIGDTISSLSCYLYRHQDGFHEVFHDDYRVTALSDMANESLSAFNLKKAMLKDLVLRGNAYAKIERSGKELSLRYLPNEVVTPKMDNGGYYFEVQSYSTEISGERYPAEVVDFYDMLVVTKDNKYNSIAGRGLLDYANDMFAMSVEESKYMYNLLVNGLSSKAILNTKTPFKREIKEQLKRDLKSFYAGANNAGKVMLLEGDVNILPLAMSPSDIKLLENKKFTITEISRFLNIPKHMLGMDRTSGTYSNITQERLQLLQNTLMPYVTILEQAINQKLLEDSEKAQGYYFKFDTTELMRMTPEDNANYMILLFQNNIVTIEEVRANLELGGDAQTIAELKLIQQAKTNMAINGTQPVGSEDEIESPEVKEPPTEENTAQGADKNKKSSKEVKE